MVTYQFVVVAGMAALLIWAVNWSRLPFIGSFIDNTLMLNTSPPAQSGSWALHSLGYPFGTQLTEVEGETLKSAGELTAILQQHEVGEVISAGLLTPDGGLHRHEIRLQPFPPSDWLNYFVIPYATGVIYLMASLYVFSLRRGDPSGQAFAIFTAAVAFTVVGLFDTYTTNRLTSLWTISLALVGGALINLALLFPEEVRFVGKRPLLRYLGYLPSGILALLALPSIGNLSRPLVYVLAWRLEFVYVVLGLAAFIAMMIYRRYRAKSPIVREQARLLLWGALISFGPLGLWLALTLFIPQLVFVPYLLLMLLFFPLTTGYSILRYRLLNTDALISRGIMYAGLSVLAVGGYALLLAGLALVVGERISPTHPLVVGGWTFLLVVCLNPVRERLQQRIDNVFFRGESVYRRQVQTFTRALTKAIELPAIVELLRRYAQQGLAPAQLHLYIYDPLSDQYVAMPDGQGRRTSDVRFSMSSGLVQALSSRRNAIFLEEERTLPSALHNERARLALLGCQLYVPLPGRQVLTGWMALGERLSGEPYTSSALEFLEALSDQAALAIERAQVVADLERRVREMDVLTRVSQGINFTIAFDDILELIYAQTNQIIPTKDFRITLYDSLSDTLYYTFCLVDDERLVEQENHPIRGGQGLEFEVIRYRRAIITADYERECRGRGTMPVENGIYAWMGVPMNAGADTIGVISISSRDPGVVYTEEQCKLLQAITDQASGAIVKARLLQETERRARQLATLNEIGRGLTSTLELKPLLNNILKSATEILNCQAGSLFLVDEQTGELVFEVVIGPVASDLVGKRLPPGTGVVGEAVMKGQGIIANDARRRKDWFEKTDEQTGFSTQDLLVVPMQLKDRVIGVIEVINKADGMPFTQADQDLLTTFSSQATIAIENARLYTMTDQALAARVEELSVMQRIDRELNASLDIQRALQITLEWAMRQSQADAGLVGMVEDQRVLVMAAAGYGKELAPYMPSPEEAAASAFAASRSYLPEQIAAIRRALENGQPETVKLAELADTTGVIPKSLYLLARAKLQIAVPIRREATVIGVLLMESRRADSFAPETLEFLTRLADHAAIAIANAQLYGEVQAANLAKSKFVSFVAHELKNPMASIKGYTELMANGMAGPVTEVQASFLATVRANVDRMNTIVSDLNDLTKIQVGSLRLDYKPVRIDEIVAEVSRSLKRQIEEKEQQVSIHLAPDLPLVWGDPVRLGQILTNLLSNATKYTKPGGQITIGAETCRADEETPTGMEVVHLWVKDSGIGISEEDQPKIFEQYFRTEISKEAATGTGLGLHIAKSLVEMQGGRIWFESKLDEGTTFHFTVPVLEAA